ncbi:Lactoylglutathione lyase OS=Streptomyces glaucescens OX=1907 GN=SGLAU_12060 PE=4 SV=1 [Streptomyces glaucescens]
MTLRTGHVGLNVTDLGRSLAFYRDLLGFTLLTEGKEEGPAVRPPG